MNKFLFQLARVNLKVMVVLHRCLQDYDLSQAVANELNEKADILTHYKKKPTDSSYDTKMALLLSQQYCSYLKYLIKFG